MSQRDKRGGTGCSNFEATAIGFEYRLSGTGAAYTPSRRAFARNRANVSIKGAGMLVRTARPSSASTPMDLGGRGPFEEAAWGFQPAFAPRS
jgi:hypothetical protein